MTLGMSPTQGDLFRSTAQFCAGRVPDDSIYAVLHRECFRLFPDELFADLFTDVGRRSVPPMIVATVMVLQRVEGLSDREAVDRFAFDARWKYAAGGLDFDYPGFVHTVLVDMRARLAGSERPDRIFEATLAAAKAAGLVGRKRVLDSTPLYDAVATMDTVTLIRSAVRGLFRVADPALAGALRMVLSGCDDYADAAKPVIDWDDRSAREELIDSRAKDAHGCLRVLDGRELDGTVAQAGRLLATVVGQDLDEGVDGVFRIARRVAADRVISTVDPQARHGHKTAARGFDGYKGHAAVDPDSELITATRVTPGNVADGAVADDLITDLLHATADNTAADDTAADDTDDTLADETAADETAADESAGQPTVYGDNAYGTGDLHQRFEDGGIDSRCKSPRPTAAEGMFTKDCFDVDLDADSVTCPAGQSAPIRRGSDGAGAASFGQACVSCPLRQQCTRSGKGRTVKVGVHEAALARARARQADPVWQADYRATRPKVERKLAHLMRRRHGGRRARVRGQRKIEADFRLLAAAVNLSRLGVLGLVHMPGRGWCTVPA
jgi:hypothetical protein